MGALLVSNLIFRAIRPDRNVANTLATYAVGNTEDYHQYMYIIKRGIAGNILYHNAYSEEKIPDVFIQPFYHVAGFLFGKLGMDAYTIYFVLHLLSLTFLFCTIYIAIQKAITSEQGQIVALLLFASATGFWNVISTNPIILGRLYLPDFNFDLTLKYHVMQPHHDVATALFIIALIALSETIYTKKHILIGGISAAILGLIHPYIQLFLFFVLIADHLFRILLMKKSYLHYVKRYIIPVLIALPTAALTYYIFVYILQFEIGLKGIVTHLPRLQTFHQYATSLGPLLFTSLLSLFFVREVFTKPFLRLLFIWAFLPLLLFFLPDYNIPINTWRLFQTYQHIPLAILSAYSLMRIVKKYSKLSILIPGIAGVFFFYGSLMYVYGYQEAVRPKYRLAWNVTIPNVLLDLFSYLQQYSPDHSVVIGGAILSNLVPEFTHNHVVIGHNGDNRNFFGKLAEIAQFLSGDMHADQVKALLKKYHASYIVFGIDAPFFNDTVYKDYPFLKEVFVEPISGFSVVQVLGDK